MTRCCCFFSFLTRASLLFDATSVRLITEALKLLGLLFTFLYLMIKMSCYDIITHRRADHIRVVEVNNSSPGANHGPVQQLGELRPNSHIVESLIEDWLQA